MRPVALVGPRGVGKTSVGRVLARILGVIFVDLDERIREHAGRTVQELFAQEGEAGFREREYQALQDLPGRPLVVATGGGIVTHAPSRALLIERFRVVGLLASPERLAARLDADPRSVDRPALAAGSFAEEARRLFEARIGLYLEVASVHFSTSGRDPECIAHAVARHVST